MTLWRTLLTSIGAGLMALMLNLPPAMADQLDDLRASGAIGEGYDGFAVARDPSVAGQVDKINKRREQIYEKQAKEQDVPVSAVGQIFAKKIVNRAPDGTWFLKQNGQWTQK